MSEDEPNYTYFGSALDPYDDEEEAARKKPIPIEEQVALDKQGRRRFHGAFTGGFSAGHFNTVGTPEGWTPATFQSSRSEKAAKMQQRPQDFMDDEDQEIFGIAPRVLRARHEFGDASSRARDSEMPSSSKDMVGVLTEMLQPTREQMGVKILKKMGWKPGQGVGPRQSRMEKKQRLKKHNKEKSNIQDKDVNGQEIVMERSPKRMKLEQPYKDASHQAVVCQEYTPLRSKPRSEDLPSPGTRTFSGARSNTYPASDIPFIIEGSASTKPLASDISYRTSAKRDSLAREMNTPMNTPTPSLPPLQINDFILKVIYGDLFSAPEDVSLAHCVGKDLHMRRGIADTFRRRFGRQEYLRSQQKQVGKVAVLQVGKRYIFYLITKESTFDYAPKLENLEESLRELSRLCKKFGIIELAMPKIAAGLDHIEWKTVLGLLVKVFNGTHMKITIYLLPEQPKSQSPHVKLRSYGKSNMESVSGFSPSYYQPLTHWIPPYSIGSQQYPFPPYVPPFHVPPFEYPHVLPFGITQSMPQAPIPLQLSASSGSSIQDLLWLNLIPPPPPPPLPPSPPLQSQSSKESSSQLQVPQAKPASLVTIFEEVQVVKDTKKSLEFMKCEKLYDELDAMLWETKKSVTETPQKNEKKRELDQEESTPSVGREEENNDGQEIAPSLIQSEVNNTASSHVGYSKSQYSKNTYRENAMNVLEKFATSNSKVSFTICAKPSPLSALKIGALQKPPSSLLGGFQTTQQKFSRKNSSLAAVRKVYGCQMGPLATPHPSTSTGDAESSDETSGDDDNVTFAPDDLPACLVQPKTNAFGMGYTGLDRRPVLSGHINLFQEPQIMNARSTGNSRVPGIKGQAFGVGAFEAEDEDIYSQDDMSRYDFSLETARERNKRKRWDDKQDKEKRMKSSHAQCLEGFKPSSKPLSTVRVFPPPMLPRDFKPQHVVKQSRFSEATIEAPGQHRRQGLGRHDMTSEERSVLIGDAAPKEVAATPSAPDPDEGSQTHQVPEADKPQRPRRRFTDLPEPVTVVPIAKLKPPPEKIEVEPTELKAGQFNPFSNNEEKGLRYRQFLTLSKDGRKDQLSLLQPSHMTEWERSRELNEFEQAARLYKPLSGPISDRFVSSATLLGSEEIPALEPPLVEESIAAAKLKMFGKMTRTKESWQPCSLLCKRFNVPEPNAGAATLVPTKRRPGFSVFDFLDSASRNNPATIETPKDVVARSENTSSVKSSETESHIVDLTARSTPSQTGPLSEAAVGKSMDFPELPTNKVDLYKAIFLSSSEDEEDTPIPEPKILETPTKIRHTSPRLVSPEPEPRKEIVRSPPRGVFASLSQINKTSSTSKASDPPVSSVPPSEDGNLYGPALPSNSFSAVMEANSTIPEPQKFEMPAPGSRWVEKSKKREKDKEKKKKKERSSSRSKHKKHNKDKKSKKKKKEKRKKRSRSSSSSLSSD